MWPESTTARVPTPKDDTPRGSLDAEEPRELLEVDPLPADTAGEHEWITSSDQMAAASSHRQSAPEGLFNEGF